MRYLITKEYAATGKTAYSKAVGELMNNLNRKSIEVAQENYVPQDLMYGVQEHDVASEEKSLPSNVYNTNDCDNDSYGNSASTISIKAPYNNRNPIDIFSGGVM